MKIRTLSDYTKERFGHKLYRLSLSAGCTCPNRDGTKGVGGCIFCSEQGSGDFASSFLPLSRQIEMAVQKVEAKLPRSLRQVTCKYIAYFQSFTSTYGEEGRLISLFEEAAARSDIAVLAIGTRPDCISETMLHALAAINRKKPVWIELGLQTMHDSTALSINRCYPRSVFESCISRLKAADLEVIVHLILGLPGETKEMMKESAAYVGAFMPQGIKLQLLHILKGTPLGRQYESAPFPVLEMDAYFDLVVECLKLLPSDTVIHRLTGDGPKRLLLAPLWSADKKRVLNGLKKRIEAAS